MAENLNSPVDDFEQAFQSVCKYLERTDTKRIPADEMKTETEVLVSQFIETARTCEQTFLCKHLQLAHAKPEEILLEECQELKQEIAKKDAAIEKHKEKLKQWQASLKGHQHTTLPARMGLSSQLPPGQLRSASTSVYSTQGQGQYHQPQQTGNQSYPQVGFTSNTGW